MSNWAKRTDWKLIERIRDYECTIRINDVCFAISVDDIQNFLDDFCALVAIYRL